MKEETAEYQKHKVYKKVLVSDCWSKTGKKPIDVRWVIVNTGDEVSAHYRARVVAKEVKVDETRLGLPRRLRLRPRTCYSPKQLLAGATRDNWVYI